MSFDKINAGPLVGPQKLSISLIAGALNFMPIGVAAVVLKHATHG
jgi:hypothetical protein